MRVYGRNNRWRRTGRVEKRGWSRSSLRSTVAACYLHCTLLSRPGVRLTLLIFSQGMRTGRIIGRSIAMIRSFDRKICRRNAILLLRKANNFWWIAKNCIFFQVELFHSKSCFFFLFKRIPFNKWRLISPAWLKFYQNFLIFRDVRWNILSLPCFVTSK